MMSREASVFLTQLCSILHYAIFTHMIVSLIRGTAEKRGITTAYQLQKALDISPTIAARLWRGEFDKLGMGTLDKLCRILKCQPGKLLHYDADSSENNKSYKGQ
jgi:DNA-binding Xre family transcriptional regulator